MAIAGHRDDVPALPKIPPTPPVPRSQADEALRRVLAAAPIEAPAKSMTRRTRDAVWGW